MAVATSCLAVPDGDMKAGSGPMCEVVGVGTMASVSSITTPSTFSMSATFIVLHARRDTVKGSRPRMVDEKRVGKYEPPKNLEPDKLFDHTARSGVNRPIERATRRFFPVPGTRASFKRPFSSKTCPPLYNAGASFPHIIRVDTYTGSGSGRKPLFTVMDYGLFYAIYLPTRDIFPSPFTPMQQR